MQTFRVFARSGTSRFRLDSPSIPFSRYSSPSDRVKLCEFGAHFSELQKALARSRGRRFMAAEQSVFSLYMLPFAFGEFSPLVESKARAPNSLFNPGPAAAEF